MNKLLIICGPTATGKTAMGIALAKKYNGEIISADSRQVYRYMDIGTGKDVGRANRLAKGKQCIYKGKQYGLGNYRVDGVPIWMLDVVNPDEPFTVSQYSYLAGSLIKDVLRRKKLPIVVGGTGLYIRSLVAPFDVQVAPDEALRQSLSSYSLKNLQEKLQEVGKDLWNAMNESDRKNPRRLIRKIEIAKGKQQKTNVVKNPYDVCKIGLRMERKALYGKIDSRVEKRVSEGMEQEIRMLLAKGYGWDLPSMSGLGYRQWKTYIEGTGTKEEGIRRWKFAEHGYARRQLTWFRRDATIHWFDVQKTGVQKDIESIVASWYT